MRIKKSAHNVESPDMTPMLDVVFIMLIFFIVSTTFVKESGVEWTSLPQNETPTPPTQKTLVITIDDSDSVTVQGRFVDRDALRSSIEAERAKFNYSSAIVQSHQVASSGALVHAVDQIRLAGISQVVAAKL